jgi:succinate dehydrogenase/fumarate reductase flavoprotein subunit
LTEVRSRLRKPVYDALVVGTGFGGAVAACRLAQAESMSASSSEDEDTCPESSHATSLAQTGFSGSEAGDCTTSDR